MKSLLNPLARDFDQKVAQTRKLHIAFQADFETPANQLKKLRRLGFINFFNFA
jgi:hypothetical protein